MIGEIEGELPPQEPETDEASVKRPRTKEEIQASLQAINETFEKEGTLSPEDVASFQEEFREFVIDSSSHYDVDGNPLSDRDAAEGIGHESAHATQAELTIDYIDRLEAGGLSLLYTQDSELFVDPTVGFGGFFTNNFHSYFDAYLSRDTEFQDWQAQHKLTGEPLISTYFLAKKTEKIRAYEAKNQFRAVRLDGTTTPSVSEEEIVIKFLESGEVFERLQRAEESLRGNNLQTETGKIAYRKARLALWPVVMEATAWFRIHGFVPRRSSLLIGPTI